MLGCDGIFDKLNNQEVVNAAWKSLNTITGPSFAHKGCGNAVENILNVAIKKRSTDNITSVIILFKDLCCDINTIMPEASNEIPEFITNPQVKYFGLSQFRKLNLIKPRTANRIQQKNTEYGEKKACSFHNFAKTLRVYNQHALSDVKFPKIDSKAQKKLFKLSITRK